ncbi:unnamed protein product [marine sediment metagenome]|uniref:Uncharacterized protein n=1 Tax=marine sediment metagenome TaxID=412755 RepID=X0WL84_9ZZZZ
MEITVGVFDENDGCISNKAYAYGQSPEGHKIRCQIYSLHHYEGKKDREGQGKNCNQGRGKISHKEKEHEYD